MPTAQERDEQDAQDPFERNPLADHGYRVGARLARPRDRRPQLVLAALATALSGAILLATVRVRLPDVTVAPPLGPRASGPLAPIPTRLPALQRFDPAAAAALVPIPVFSGGLRWLDPTAGVISGPPFSGARGWIFAGSDGGAWCVCYDAPWSPTGTIERTTIARYDPTGRQLSRTVVAELESELRTSDAIQRDAQRSPDGRYVYIAATIRDEAGWAVRLERIALSPKPALVDSVDVGRVDLAPTGTFVDPPILRVAPDSSQVEITVRFVDRASATSDSQSLESRWRASFPDPGSGQEVTVGNGELRQPVFGTDCQGEGWVTDEVYARLCVDSVDGRRIPVARLRPISSPLQDVQVGDPVGTNDLEWLVDGTAGVVYRWSPFSHIVARLDVATGDVTQRTDLSQTPAAAKPDTDAPARRPARADWQPLVSAEAAATTRLAGSVDGSLLYAIGETGSIDGAGPSGPLYASTGIFVFDAATLGLVAHWKPNAMYSQVGVSPDGRSVLAAGLEGMTTDGRVADWPASLTFHDATDGHVVEQLSQLAGDEGFFVDLLAPGPVP